MYATIIIIAAVLLFAGVIMRTFYVGMLSICLGELALLFYIEMDHEYIIAMGGFTFILKMLAAHELQRLERLSHEPSSYSVPSLAKRSRV